jgi:hypothetical protein
MGKAKPSAEDMRQRALKMLKKAKEIELAEKNLILLKLGQLVMDYLGKKITVEELATEAGKITGLTAGFGGVDGP